MSIGFAIPVRQLFTGVVVWRGIVYEILMAIAKCVTGIWLTVLPASPGFARKIKRVVGRKSKNRKEKETTIRQDYGGRLEASSGDPK